MTDELRTLLASIHRPAVRRPIAAVPQSSTVEVFGRRDIEGWGIGPGQVRTFVRQGLWIRLRRDVYADALVLAACQEDPERLHKLLTRAAIAALTLPAYAFGSTSTVVHGLPSPAGPPSMVHLVRPVGTDQRALRRSAGSLGTLTTVRLHSHDLVDGDLAEVDGLPVVSRDVAAITAAADHSLEWAVVVLDAVAWQRPDAPTVLREVVERWRGLRGIGTARKALPLVRTGAQSPFESLSRLAVVSHGLPEPRLQVPFYDSAGLIGYADMVWDDWRVIGECDGLLKYDSRDVLVREKEREDRLRALGFVVVRWTWHELMRDRGATVAGKIRRARASALGVR